ncbi:MAG: hypothetical protein M3164_06195 [Actinomycetota bacterium]|nr:hypothetical protein [Actinomycetota bacterium]
MLKSMLMKAISKVDTDAGAGTSRALERVKSRIAQRLTEYGINQGPGSAGTVEIMLLPAAERIFRAHWTGYRLVYPQPTLFLRATLKDGSFWSEGYISDVQPSFVLAFRKQPHPTRGTGAERPDDKFASPESIEVSQTVRKQRIEEGLVPDEEIMRYEDFDFPEEAVDQFFNYTSFYCLRAVNAEWTEFGYVADESVDWENVEVSAPAGDIDAAIDEGLKKSDILWLIPDTDLLGRAIPCWFVYTKDKRLFVLSGEPEQRIPYAGDVRSAHVVTRWKGRDARMAEFDADVRPITAANRQEFEEIGKLLVAKRQSVRASPEETIESWMRDGVILELFPRV